MNKENMTVLQTWVERLPIRMQSTLVLGLRGPDTHNTPNLKTIVRWMRGLAFKPGNPANWQEFMTHRPASLEEKGPAAKELEFCSFHCFTHILQSLKVIAFRHPFLEIREIAHNRACCMCLLLHMHMETDEEFEQRLGYIEWPGEVQPDNFEEAQEIMGN
jgi:hypothetical protein